MYSQPPHLLVTSYYQLSSTIIIFKYPAKHNHRKYGNIVLLYEYKNKY